MVAIPAQISDPVAEAIFAHYQKTYSSEKQRPYLGASSIGKPCSRALWYGLRWAKAAQFSGRMYRLFQTGHLQEPRVLKDLKVIGCKVEGIDPSTGRQWAFSEASLGHHFAGNCDGVVSGVPGGGSKRHILEIKTASAKAFAQLVKDGVQKAKPEHFAQMQIYMHWAGLERALYLAVNKDTDDIHTERVHYDKAFAQGLIDKAGAIIFAVEPPAKLSEDASWFECKFCDYASICHGQEVAAVSCRTCAMATPVMDGIGAWRCTRYEAEIPQDAQREGCDGHRYIPILLERFAKPVDTEGDAVVYQMADGSKFLNGDPAEYGAHISSREIHAVQDKSSLTDVRVVEMRLQIPDSRLTA